MMHSYTWHSRFKCVIQVTSLCAITSPLSKCPYTYTWRDVFKCATYCVLCVMWHVHMCDMAHLYVWHDASICVTWRTHMCDMMHSYVWHDSTTCEMVHSYSWYSAFICVIWRIHICDMAHSCMWHDSTTGLARCIPICHMMHSYV